MTHAEMISVLDKKYSRSRYESKDLPSDAVVCPNEGKSVKSQNGKLYSDHGDLVVHASGAFLVCGRCNYQHPVGRVG